METKKCKKCKKDRRTTQFSLTKRGEDGFVRSDVCRICGYDGLTADKQSTILREAYRNYLSWRDLIVYPEDRDPPYTITYEVPKEEGSDEIVPVTISFLDLERALKQFKEGAQREGTVLSKRKEEAFYLHVIRDMLQRDVAEHMGITTVSVGQYVKDGMQQLCKYYFGEDADTRNADTALEE